MDKELFRGTAWHYARYRPPYPEALFSLLVQRFGLDATSRLLDLGCGTGELAIPLSRYFEEVVAVDPDPEMLTEAQRKAREASVTNMVWIESQAEELTTSLGSFRLVTMGSAFHWMDQERVLGLVRGLLVERGGLAIVGSSSWWAPTEEWHRVVIGLVKKYLGEERRAGSGTFKEPQERYEDLLARYRFTPVESYQLAFPYTWTPETVLGLLCSTSFCSKKLLGDRVGRFEEELRGTLLHLNPQGKFTEKIPIYVLLGFKSKEKGHLTKKQR